MTEAFLWGALAASSLMIGGVLALAFRVSGRLVGLVLGFGAGVLISAVAYELVEEAFTASKGSTWVAVGLFAGALVYFAGDELIDRRGGEKRKSMGGEQEEGSGHGRNCRDPANLHSSPFGSRWISGGAACQLFRVSAGGL